MRKKAIHALLALAALVAFAVMPAVASATNDPEATHPTGELLAINTKVKATNIGDVLITNSSTSILMRCNSVTLTGTLTKNNGSNIEATITGANWSGTGGSGSCTGSFGNATVTTSPATNGLPWCLRSTSTMKTDEFQIRGASCTAAARPIRYVLDIIFGGQCVYQRGAAEPVVGTYQTHPTDAVFSIVKSRFTLLEGSFVCPSEGYLDMSFTLETDTTPTADPLYIS